jgi:hypothetical protein
MYQPEARSYAQAVPCVQDGEVHERTFQAEAASQQQNRIFLKTHTHPR